MSKVIATRVVALGAVAAFGAGFAGALAAGLAAGFFGTTAFATFGALRAAGDGAEDFEALEVLRAVVMRRSLAVGKEPATGALAVAKAIAS